MKPIINTWLTTDRLVHIETNPAGLDRIEAAILEARSTGRAVFAGEDGGEFELTVDPLLKEREVRSNIAFRRQALICYGFMLLVWGFAIVGLYSIIEIIRK